MSVEHGWSHTDRIKPKYWEKNNPGAILTPPVLNKLTVIGYEIGFYNYNLFQTGL
jgi:hypothetical protein